MSITVWTNIYSQGQCKLPEPDQLQGAPNGKAQFYPDLYNEEQQDEELPHPSGSACLEELVQQPISDPSAL
ncbi:hypothetical protein DACRYDRAFT_112229 [Dacryopinax primogenitus]|uniref:Uncharacterized protein n=1 Tax=Dacryopinax primogenitus (strain DJM 731) TaxID=1858805 RepID=M5FQC4_DACPD|nr:uncharacterized protein DACRYDRAFT_112229 [Dacryopinax primogenitus]EJT96889.1 hypothetical protein DACRYDRAFT_112229 [Dacryopinax primogenitus]